MSSTHKPVRTAIYTRVSTDEQAAKGYSLRDQEARLREHCERTGREVVAHYQDDASAKSFDRAGFNRLMERVRKHPGEIDELLVLKWDRFSRDATGALETIRLLRSRGVEVQAVEQPVDHDVPEQQIMLLVYLGIPEVENRRRSINTVMGTRRALREGRWCNAAPVGYRNGRDERGKRVIVPDERAPLVREAFELAAKSDLAISEILVRLRQRGLRYSRSKMYEMLRREVYKGYVRVPAWRDEPEELVRGLHEPLVSPELWDRVQEVRFGQPTRRSPRTRGGVRADTPLRGHLVCPKCAAGGVRSVVTSSVSRGRGGAYAYYHCHRCGDRPFRVRAEEVHEAMPAFLRGLSLAPAVARLYREALSEVAAETGAEARAARVAAERVLEELEARLLRVDEMFVGGELEADSYHRLKAKLKGEVGATRDRLAGLADGQAEACEEAVRAADLMVRLPAIWEATWGTAPQAAYDLVGSIVPEGIAYEGGFIRTPFGAGIIGLFGQKKGDADSDDESASRVVAGVRNTDRHKPGSDGKSGAEAAEN